MEHVGLPDGMCGLTWKQVLYNVLMWCWNFVNLLDPQQTSDVNILLYYIMCRDGGGVLHIHGNVNDSDETRWLDNVVESISNIAKNHGKNGAFMLWSVAMHFCSPRVKIPFLWHFVSQDYLGTCQWSTLNAWNGTGRREYLCALPRPRNLVVDVSCRQI